jgi:hypothetical protein
MRSHPSSAERSSHGRLAGKLLAAPPAGLAGRRSEQESP